MINGAAMNIELYNIESQILRLLSESEGNILDNTALIETLAEAKVSFPDGSSIFLPASYTKAPIVERKGSIPRLAA